MVRTITASIKWTLQQSLMAIRFSLPFVFWMTIHTLWMCINALATFWKGVPNIVDQIANHWLARASDNGFPTIWSRYLYWVFFAIAILVIIVSWIVTTFITVFGLKLIFGFL